MHKVGVLVITLVLMSGCTAIFGEDEEVIQARQVVEDAKQAKRASLQAELERLRSEVQAKKIELQKY